MKRLSFVIVLAAFTVIFSCCGDDDPAEPENGDQSSPYSGSFSVANLLTTNDCALPVPPPAVMSVVIEGDTIWFGGLIGLWDEATLTGTSLPDTMTVPVPPDCNTYSMAVYVITYSSPDTFSGVYGADFWKDATCPNADPCAFRYEINGTR